MDNSNHFVSGHTLKWKINSVNNKITNFEFPDFIKNNITLPDIHILDYSYVAQMKLEGTVDYIVQLNYKKYP